MLNNYLNSTIYYNISEVSILFPSFLNKKKQVQTGKKVLNCCN